jgi:cytochrome c oxidase subunit 5b
MRALCPFPSLQVWWGVIEDGQPPKQIIEGGEYFVLKRLPSTSTHH